MNVCLEEIRRCRKATPRPNFLLLVGNRRGWMPVPPQIPLDEWDRICVRLSGGDRALLETWYARDDNSDPPQYRLRPRTGEFTDRDAQKGARTGWKGTEARLHEVLAGAVAALELAEQRRRVYLASATEQEIAVGALEVERPDQVVCFVREIDGYPDPAECAPDASVREWVDPDQSPLDATKERLRERLVAPPDPLGHDRNRPGRDGVLTETVEWAGDRPAIDEAYLSRFAQRVAVALEAAIGSELDNLLPRAAEPGSEDQFLDGEGRAHRGFAQELLAFFTGRKSELAQVSAYLRGGVRRPLVLHGEGGTGKSALMAAVAQNASRDLPGSVVVARYVGATPASSDGRAVLEDICHELARRAGASETQVPTDYADLVVDFRAQLGRATADKPILVLVDSLDQLSVFGMAHVDSWVPSQLPKHARLVVSNPAR